MNVAIITDSFPPMVDGVSQCSLGYASTLHGRSDSKCIVITPHMPNVKYSYPFPVYTFKSIGLPYANYRLGHPFTPKLISTLKRKKIDILHAHSPFISMTVARQLRYFLNIPIIFTQHTKWEFDIARAVSSKTLQKMIERYAYSNIKNADEVWAVSRIAGEHLASKGYSRDYQVMPNGTDFSVINKNNRLLRHINTRFELPENVPILLFVGRIMWYKNIKLIIEALEILHKQSFEFRMIFVGDGEDLPDVVSLTECKKMSDIVFFTGKISDRELLMAYFSRSDLFVFPSVYDNAPLVIREAAACSCPSLVIRNSSASEILEDGVTGFFADEDIKSIANSIKAALSDRTKLKQVASNASCRVYLSWEGVIQQSIIRYGEVIRKFKTNDIKAIKKDVFHCSKERV